MRAIYMIFRREFAALIADNDRVNGEFYIDTIARRMVEAGKRVAAFTVIAAKELARYGVTVNAIAPAALTRMTENLGMGQADEMTKAMMSPRWIAPVVTWLASAESADVTGRVFDVTGQALSVAEGWHRGPTREHPTDDPAELGAVVRELVAEARPNANMLGYDER